MLKSLVSHQRIDEDVLRVALFKIINHLCYLKAENHVFAFSDETLKKTKNKNSKNKHG